MILWIQIVSTALSSLLGVLVFGGIVAYWTHRWAEHRQRSERRDQLRLDLYLSIIDLVLDNEKSIAERSSSGDLPPVDLQLKRLDVSHRLKLLGSMEVKKAYNSYRQLVFQETSLPQEDRPRDPNAVTEARESLISAMATDIQGFQEMTSPSTEPQERKCMQLSDWLSYYLHQDQLLWSRLRTLSTVQVATLGAGYFLRSTSPSTGILAMLLGMILSTLLFFLWERDRKYRQVILAKAPELKLNVARSWFSPLKGREAAMAIFWLLIASNLFLLLAIVSD